MSKSQAEAAMQAMKLAQENPQAIQHVAAGVRKAQEGTERAGGSTVVGGAALAGAAAGIVAGGLLLGAPIMLGVAGAAGAAYLATTDGETGDVARKAGHAANNAVNKGLEANEKHKLTDKATAAASGAIQKAKEIDQEHQVVAKTKAAASSAAQKAVEFNQKHDVTGKVGKGLLMGFNKLTDALASKDESKKITDK